MKKVNVVFSIMLASVLAVSAAGCGNGETSPNSTGSEGQNNTQSVQNAEEYFEWDDNIILALTEEGKKQESITIPQRCEAINSSIFIDSSTIKAVDFESDADVDMDILFYGAKSVQRVELPKELSVIPAMSFSQCTSLESITIPAGVQEIGEYAFQASTALKEVVIEGNIAAIGPHTFDGCTSLESIEIPDTVTEIGEYAFYQCTALKKVTLPTSLKTVGAFAFSNNGVEEIHVPAEVELTAYDTTSFVQTDHTIDVYVVENSWMDQNFDAVFSGAYNKMYS